MAGMLSPLVRTRQPQQVTPINWANPITRGLIVARNGHTTFNSAGGVFSYVGSPGQVVTIDGVGTSFSSAGGTGVSVGTSAAYNPSDMTVFCIFTPATVAATSQLMSRDDASLGRSFTFDLHSSAGFGLRFYVNGGGSVGTNELREGVTAASGRRYVAAATLSGAVSKLYSNGYVVASSVSFPAKNASTGDTQIGRRTYSGFNEPANGVMPICLMWSRALSEAEIRSVSVNPWQIFAPISRNVFAEVVGGSGSQTLTPSLYSNTQTFYAPALAAGAVAISPSLYSNSPTFYAPTVSIAGGPQQLTASRFDNTPVFYAPTLAPGAVTVTTSLYNNSQTFYSLTLTASKTLSAALFTNAPTFYAPIVSLGSGPQVISPPLLVNAQSYFTQIVTPGQVSLFPALLTNSQSFYAATVSDGSTGLPDAAARYTVTAQPRRLATSAGARSYQVIK